MLTGFHAYFWRPPRAHGEVVEDRTVGFIELFYDLVYVVVIARATHHLAAHTTARGVYEFAVIFGMIWIAWMNGTLYHDLHGGEDGRSRTFIFLQMLILALVGVYTEDAAADGGVGFGLAYVVFLLVVTWQWYTVRRIDSAEYSSVTARYLAGMIASIVVVAGGLLVADETRMAIWAGFVALWVVGVLIQSLTASDDVQMTLIDSTVERFGLFTIIVLGEVIVGVVTGISESARTFGAVATGLLGLCVGFGMWWSYFDFVGRRMPSQHGGPVWMAAHFPITMGIAATGAAMVTLVERADEAESSVASAWLLAGSGAVVLVFLALAARSLADFSRLRSIYVPVQVGLLIGAAAMLLVAALRPTPWLLTAAMVVILMTVWLAGVRRWLSLDDPEAALP